MGTQGLSRPGIWPVLAWVCVCSSAFAQARDTTVALAAPASTRPPALVTPAPAPVTAQPVQPSFRKKVSPPAKASKQSPVARPAPAPLPALNLQLASASPTSKPMGAARSAPVALPGAVRPAAGLDLRAPVSDRWWVDARMVDDGDRHPEPGLTVGVKLKF